MGPARRKRLALLMAGLVVALVAAGVAVAAISVGGGPVAAGPCRPDQVRSGMVADVHEAAINLLDVALTDTANPSCKAAVAGPATVSVLSGRAMVPSEDVKGLDPTVAKTSTFYSGHDRVGYLALALGNWCQSALRPTALEITLPGTGKWRLPLPGGSTRGVLCLEPSFGPWVAARFESPVSPAAPTAVPADQLVAVQMSTSRHGLGLTSSMVGFCLPQGPEDGCESESVPRPVDLAETDDGGADWQVVGSPLPYDSDKAYSLAPALAFSGSGHGYAEFGGLLFATDDGGQQWQKADFGGPNGFVTSLVLDGGRAWVTGMACTGRRSVPCRQLVAVSAPGAGLKPVVPGGWPSGIEGDLIGTAGQGHVLLAEQSSPWAVLEVSTSHGLVTRQVAVPPGCQPLSIVSHNNTWWLLGAALQPRGAQWADVRVYATRDGGRHWSLRSKTGPDGPMAEAPEFATEDMSISPNGKVFWLTAKQMQVSTDGGGTWTYAPRLTSIGGTTSVDAVWPAQAWFLVQGTGLWESANGVKWDYLSGTFEMVPYNL